MNSLARTSKEKAPNTQHITTKRTISTLNPLDNHEITNQSTSIQLFASSSIGAPIKDSNSSHKILTKPIQGEPPDFSDCNLDDPLVWPRNGVDTAINEDEEEFSSEWEDNGDMVHMDH